MLSALNALEWRVRFHDKKFKCSGSVRCSPLKDENGRHCSCFHLRGNC